MDGDFHGAVGFNPLTVRVESSEMAVMILEKHYTIKDVAGVLNMTGEAARLLVKDEPGVLRFSPLRKNGKPGSRTMYRIPESVLQRILRRNANV